jgi:hypothetical protein
MKKGTMSAIGVMERPTAYEMVWMLLSKTQWTTKLIATFSRLGEATVQRIKSNPLRPVHDSTWAQLWSVFHKHVPQKLHGATHVLYHLRDLECGTSVTEEALGHGLFVVKEALRSLSDGCADLTERALLELAWGHYHRILADTLRIESQMNTELAGKRYNNAANLVSAGEDDVQKILHFKAIHNGFMLPFMAADKDTRSRDPEIRQWLEDHNYLVTARMVHELTRDDWRVPRNGLVAASVLEDATACVYFFEQLKEISAEFEDLEFVPAKGVPSLKRDTDLHFFRKTIGAE